MLTAAALGSHSRWHRAGLSWPRHPSLAGSGRYRRQIGAPDGRIDRCLDACSRSASSTSHRTTLTSGEGPMRVLRPLARLARAFPGTSSSNREDSVPARTPLLSTTPSLSTIERCPVPQRLVAWVELAALLPALSDSGPRAVSCSWSPPRPLGPFCGRLEERGRRSMCPSDTRPKSWKQLPGLRLTLGSSADYTPGGSKVNQEPPK